jgi:pimeloyl-ACP methyl ester carboxylesterase
MTHSFGAPYSFHEESVVSPYCQEHRLHVLRWQAKKNREMPPVVCLHGLTRQAEDFILLGEALSQTRNVYSFSMAGRGKSDFLPPAAYNYLQYVTDCRFLMKHYGLDKVDWVGTSLGGILAFMIAGAEGLDSSPIRRLVLNDIGPFVTASSLRGLAIRITGYDGTPFKTRGDAEAYCRFAWEDLGINDQKDWIEFLDFNIVSVAGGFRLRYDARILDVLREPQKITDVNLWSYYCRMTCPTLVLHGETSKLLTPDIIAEMATQGPKPEFVTFSGCGHAPALIDLQQIGAVTEFLNRP